MPNTTETQTGPAGRWHLSGAFLLKFNCNLVYFRNEIKSGCVSRCHGNGCLDAVDRNDDMIFSGGSNVYAREGEEALLGPDGITVAAGAGVSHRKWRATVASALVSSGAEMLSPVILDDCRCAEPSCFRKPVRVLGCEALPTDGYGKLFERDLCAHDAQVP